MEPTPMEIDSTGESKEDVDPNANAASSNAAASSAPPQPVRTPTKGAQMGAPLKKGRSCKADVAPEKLAAAGCFKCEGGTQPRAKHLSSDGGTFMPLRLVLGDNIYWYNAQASMFCFNCRGYWFLAPCTREGHPVVGQNPEQGVSHPVDLKMPWHFLSAEPDETFKLVRIPTSGCAKIRNEEPKSRPMGFENRISSLKQMRKYYPNSVPLPPVEKKLASMGRNKKEPELIKQDKSYRLEPIERKAPNTPGKNSGRSTLSALQAKAEAAEKKAAAKKAKAEKDEKAKAEKEEKKKARLEAKEAMEAKRKEKMEQKKKAAEEKEKAKSLKQVKRRRGWKGLF